ncbi:hypothetical protein AGR4B_Cc100178 [Agrobacterium tumefaciens str. CFBP 5621]|nr:hypothetical protein AGR4B_Cc100178 [Agrobacterium tumefaciens str. CFBP 5621]
MPSGSAVRWTCRLSDLGNLKIPAAIAPRNPVGFRGVFVFLLRKADFNLDSVDHEILCKYY